MHLSRPKFTVQASIVQGNITKECVLHVYEDYLSIFDGIHLLQRIIFYTRQWLIKWSIKNDALYQMIITNSTLKYCIQVEDKLQLLKFHLDSKLPYVGFSELHRPVSLIANINNGQVLKALNLLTLEAEVLKVLNTSKLDSRTIDQEISILQHFKKNPHPNIIDFKSFFVEDDCIILVFEHCQVRSLHGYIQQKQDLKNLKRVMKALLKAVNHMHKCGVMHRDLKLDNILLKDSQDAKSVKMIDFGFARFITEESPLMEKCGTPGYIAPEIFHEDYTEKCDIYSLGCVFHWLLSGMPLFRNRDRTRLMVSNVENNFNLDLIDNPHGRDLLLHMLSAQEERWNAKQCLDHTFFGERLQTKVQKVRTLSIRNPFVQI